MKKIVLLGDTGLLFCVLGCFVCNNNTQVVLFTPPGAPLSRPFELFSVDKSLIVDTGLTIFGAAKIKGRQETFYILDVLDNRTGHVLLDLCSPLGETIELPVTHFSELIPA